MPAPRWTRLDDIGRLISVSQFCSPLSVPAILTPYLLFVGTMSDIVAEIAQAFLAAMDTEEPFRLLRTLPEKLKELWAIEAQSAPVDVCGAVFRISYFAYPCSGTSSRGNIGQPIKSL